MSVSKILQDQRTDVWSTNNVFDFKSRAHKEVVPSLIKHKLNSIKIIQWTVKKRATNSEEN